MTANLANETDFDRAFRQKSEDLDKTASVARDACCGQCGGECQNNKDDDAAFDAEWELHERLTVIGRIRKEGGA